MPTTQTVFGWDGNVVVCIVGGIAVVFIAIVLGDFILQRRKHRRRRR